MSTTIATWEEAIKVERSREFDDHFGEEIARLDHLYRAWSRLPGKTSEDAFQAKAGAILVILRAPQITQVGDHDGEVWCAARRMLGRFGAAMVKELTQFYAAEVVAVPAKGVIEATADIARQLKTPPAGGWGSRI